ncbi:MAG: gamma-glutamyltransferase, partial [Gammaproteobacteria bacterium]|nr:gamma-glutamyltransferase [Gammaproteobacteria bacterium]
ILDIVKPIYRVDKQSRDTFTTDAGDIKKFGERYNKPGLAQVLDALAHEGEDLFYRGEVAQLIAAVTEDGGCLQREDLEQYELVRRRPLISDYASHRIMTNPLPSSGGALIHFALQLLSAYRPGQYRRGSYEQLSMLAATMKATNRARLETAVLKNELNGDGMSALLDKEFLAQFLSELKNRVQALRGTTHISVVDAQGNAAAMTVSNGEGCGHMVPGTGIMLNNMLGEEDLNPRGFHRWQTNQRMTSMMAPTLIQDKTGNVTALGSGGSNRIRTTILQLLVNRLDFGMSLEEAIIQPRIHLEGEMLNIEGGIREDVVQKLIREYPDHVLWPEHNLFFGGAHAVAQTVKGFEAFGDPRRGGCAVVL